MKQAATEKVMTAIRKVLAGEVYVSEQMATRLLHQIVNIKGSPAGEGGGVAAIADRSPVARLSDRELEIFTMIGHGLGTRDRRQAVPLC